jgi:hypothetical protein
MKEEGKHSRLFSLLLIIAVIFKFHLSAYERVSDSTPSGHSSAKRIGSEPVSAHNRVALDDQS